MLCVKNSCIQVSSQIFSIQPPQYTVNAASQSKCLQFKRVTVPKKVIEFYLAWPNK